jgi:hypothetical protein
VTKLQSGRPGFNTGRRNIIFPISLDAVSDASSAGCDIGSQGTLPKENWYPGYFTERKLVPEHFTETKLVARAIY